MGELRKPSSLDPKGWVALRPVSGAAATVFFLREVLGLAAAWEAEPLSLLSTVEQGALLLHAVCRICMSGRLLAVSLANRVQGPDYPQLQCPVGTEKIAALVLQLTQRVPGVEVAMANAVDEAIGRFPQVRSAKLTVAFSHSSCALTTTVSLGALGARDARRPESLCDGRLQPG